MPHSLTLFPLHRVTLVHPLQNYLRSNPSAAQAPQIRTLTAKSWPLDNLYGLSHAALNFIRWISTHLTCCCFTGLHCCRYSTRCTGLYFTVCPERDNGRNMLDYHRYKIWWKCYRLFLVESWDLLRSLCREVCRQVLDISNGWGALHGLPLATKILCLNSDQFMRLFRFFRQICLAAVGLGGIRRGCKKFGTVKPGETCHHIVHRYFKGRRANFKVVNGGAPCRDPLFQGRSFCLS